LWDSFTSEFRRLVGEHGETRTRWISRLELHVSKFANVLYSPIAAGRVIHQCFIRQILLACNSPMVYTTNILSYTVCIAVTPNAYHFC